MMDLLEMLILTLTGDGWIDSLLSAGLPWDVFAECDGVDERAPAIERDPWRLT